MAVPEAWSSVRVAHLEIEGDRAEIGILKADRWEMGGGVRPVVAHSVAAVGWSTAAKTSSR